MLACQNVIATPVGCLLLASVSRGITGSQPRLVPRRILAAIYLLDAARKIPGWPRPTFAFSSRRLHRAAYARLGEPSRPTTGYDKKTIAADIRELVRGLGYEKIPLVGHDVGLMAAYSYTAPG